MTPCPSSWLRPLHCLHACSPVRPADICPEMGWRDLPPCAHALDETHLTCCACPLVLTFDQWLDERLVKAAPR
jgi:hypothetical protein